MGYCNWDFSSEENKRYHDEEWGMPLHDDRGQFEFLMMEVMQCGLNWNMMIKKRDIFRSCNASDLKFREILQCKSLYQTK